VPRIAHVLSEPAVRIDPVLASDAVSFGTPSAEQHVGRLQVRGSPLQVGWMHRQSRRLQQSGGLPRRLSRAEHF